MTLAITCPAIRQGRALMKIDRISRLKGHRIFRDYAWPQDLPDFSRFNLIYGWNGAGKTTLSNLFRHLSEKTGIAEGEVKIRVGGQDISGVEISTAALPQIRIFNRDTVDRSIFESPNQSLPPVYFLGEDSADKQKRIEELKVERDAALSNKAAYDLKKKVYEREFEQFRKDRASAIKNLLTSSTAGPYFNSYDASKFKKKVEELVLKGDISPLSDEERVANVAKKEGVPREAITLSGSDLPDYASVLERATRLLSRSIVATTIEALSADATLSKWVSDGLKLHEGKDSEACKYCSQPIPESRREALEAHFNDEFRSFQVDIESLINEVDSTIVVSRNPQGYPDKGLFYPHLADRYQEKLEVLRQQSMVLATIFERIKVGLVDKKENPFKTLEVSNYLLLRPGEEKREGTLEFIFSILMTTGSVMSSSIGSSAHKEIKKIVSEHNAYTTNFSDEQKAARSALEVDEIARSLDAYRQFEVSIQQSEDSSRERKARLDEIDAEVGELERAIRHHLRAADELTQDMASYLGRRELQFVARETGYVISRNGSPATNLSDGERTAVSFIYFLKSLEDSGFDLENGVVVIDDPVSSLDSNAIYCAFGFMKSRLKGVGQLFVLTHNFTFFRQVNNWLSFQKKSQRYMLKAAGVGVTRNSGVYRLDPLLRDYQSEYHYLFQLVHSCSQALPDQGLGSLYGMPNIARRLLDAVMTFKYPDKAGELNVQINSILGFDEAKRARIIRFTHSYSHNEMLSEGEHDLSILAEGPEIMKDVLELVRHVDGHHYERMVSLVGAVA